MMLYVQFNITPMTESSRDVVDNSRHSNTSVRIHKLKTSQRGATLFPKLEECAHFHYEQADLQQIKVWLSV